MNSTETAARHRQVAEVIARIEARHAEYRAYLCMMSDHGCECVALAFDQWAQVTR